MLILHSLYRIGVDIKTIKNGEIKERAIVIALK